MSLASDCPFSMVILQFCLDMLNQRYFASLLYNVRNLDLEYLVMCKGLMVYVAV